MLSEDEENNKNFKKIGNQSINQSIKKFVNLLLAQYQNYFFMSFT